MADVRVGPLADPPRRGDGRVLLAGLAASLVLHAIAGWWVVTSHTGLPHPPPIPADIELVVYTEPVLDPPPVVRIPPPSTPVPRPARPAESPAADPPPTLEPPEYIPHDVPPRLVNADEVVRWLEAEYPPDLPPGAARSHVVLWLFVDTRGRVTRLRLQQGSGYPELDSLAARLAPGFAYQPALNRGRRVSVWVAQRIRFHPPGGG